MFKSLEEWLDVPVVVRPFVGRTATGDKKFGESYSILCYPQGEVNIVRNWQGVEVVSHTKLYMRGTEKVTKFDNILFEEEELPVQAISTFYKDGVPNMKVVYV